MEHLGLIAGNGIFPILFAKEARERGYRITAVAHIGETRDEIDGAVDSLTWVRVGQLGKMIRSFQAAGVRRAVMAGGINKVGSLFSLRPDWRGLKFLGRAASMGDDALLRGIAEEFESAGIEIVSSTLFLEHIVVSEGHIAGTEPDSKAMADIETGRRVLAATGGLDIGQSVVIENGVVLAVEAVDGTDATIERGGKLGKGQAVVVKAAKVNQDLRFDVPAVGPETIDMMARSGAKTLALEAGRTIILDGDKLAQKAEAAGVAVYGFEGSGPAITDTSEGESA